MSDSIKLLQAEYDDHKSLYERLVREISNQISELVRQAGISLAVPIECRVKSWGSIAKKCERHKTFPTKLSEIADIAGIRIILLYKRDQEKVCSLISSNFKIVNVEDTHKRLGVDQFGYGSVHYEAKPKEEWCSVPSLREFNGLNIEIQVRTASQHIWAAVSHQLQYKIETNVPDPVKRSINRVAALLELIDLEYERVLQERERYMEELKKGVIEGELLNTDLLQKILSEAFPVNNLAKDEDFSALLLDLEHFNVHDVVSLKQLIAKHHKVVMASETRAVAEIQKKGEESHYQYIPERIAKGVFYSHVGLARRVLEEEFPKRWDDYISGRAAQRFGGKKVKL